MILKIPLHVVHLDSDGYHLFFTATINGSPANLLVDTGASKTVFDINRITKFIRKRKKCFESMPQLSSGLGTNTMQVYYTTIKEFGISDLIIKDFPAILLDMTHVNESYVTIGNDPIDGVLGNDLLMEFKAVIDFDKKLLKLKV